MAMNEKPRFPDLIRWAGVQIVPADTTTKKTVWTPPTNGSKLTFLSVSSDDTAVVELLLYVTKSAVDYLIGEKQIPITAGFITGAPAFNWFDGTQIPGLPIDADGQRHMLLESGCVLKVAPKATITAAKTVHITAFGMDF